jgi:hypothetical protein
MADFRYNKGDIVYLVYTFSRHTGYIASQLEHMDILECTVINRSSNGLSDINEYTLKESDRSKRHRYKRPTHYHAAIDQRFRYRENAIYKTAKEAQDALFRVMHHKVEWIKEVIIEYEEISR